MLFNSLEFLVFFALFLPAFFFSRGGARHLISLSASYLFYAWWDWRFAFLLAGSTLVGYYCGARIARSQTAAQSPAQSSPPWERRAWLLASIVAHLAVLGVFKYYNFFADSLVMAFGTVGIDIQARTLDVILPVGISFYTFQTLSYTIDIYRGRIQPEAKLLNFGVFVSFFPQLVAGPIVRAERFLPQLRTDPLWRDDRIILGLEWVLWGFFLKVCLADNAAQFVDVRYGEPGAYTPASLTLATVFFAFQIYGDFAGYSLIAIGIAKMLGYDLGENFRRPYFSTGFSEFWGRWHISLSSWLRDYVYIPLGGSKGGYWGSARNVAITMMLSGLWHGAGWTFLAWAALHVVYLLGERVVGLVLRPSLIRRIVALPMVFALTCLAWVFFRAPDMATAWDILGTIWTWDTDPTRSFGPQRLLAAKVMGLAVFAMAIDFAIERGWAERYRRSLAIRAAGFGALLAIIAATGAFGANQFIYFQF